MVRELEESAHEPAEKGLDGEAALGLIRELCELYSDSQLSSRVYTHIDALHEKYGDAGIDILLETAKRMQSESNRIILQAEDTEGWSDFKKTVIRDVVKRHRHDAGKICHKRKEMQIDLKRTLLQRRRDVSDARTLQPSLTKVILFLEGKQTMNRQKQEVNAIANRSRETLERGEDVLQLVCHENGIDIDKLKQEAARKRESA